MIPTKIAPSDLSSSLPALLRTTDAWIGHREKKPVVLPAGRRAARTNQPTSWRPFADALLFYTKTYADSSAGLGFVMQREQGIVFIDFDHCIDAAGVLAPWAESLLAPFRGRTFIERSRSGRGLHVMALGSVPHAFGKLVPPGAVDDQHVEVYNHLRYVAVTGDLFDGAPASLAPMQAEIDALLEQLGAEKNTGTGDSPAHDELSSVDMQQRVEEVESALRTLDPDMQYEEWLRIGMAIHHGLGARGLELWDTWSARGRKYVPGDCAERWASFRRSGVTLGTLFFMAGEAGWKSPLDDPKRQFDVIEQDETESSTSDVHAEGTYVEWIDGGYQLWKPNPKQEILVPCFNEANLFRFFTTHPDWRGRLRYNIRTMMPERDGDPIDMPASYAALFQSHAFLGWTKRAYSVKTVQATIQTAAEANSYDPVADWLRSLEWDGVRRLESLAGDLGIENTPITRRCLTRWLIGAVARAIRPGCKMQNMLLLLGPQGRQKSGLLERLAVRKEWFHESHVDLSNKEGYITLDRKWIVEFAELDGLRKVDVEKVKAFISESSNNYRAPYARTAMDHPRHYVFAGTANEDKVLRDPTGARRFWTVRCPEILNLQKLTPEYVALLWAEARTMYENGVRWWDDAPEVDELNERNTDFYANSAADILIAKVVEEEFAPHGTLRLKQLIARLMEMHIIQPSTSENAVGSVLRRMRWEQQAMRVDGHTLRFWFPESVPTDQRKNAAVINMEAWKKSTGSFDPVDPERKDA